MAKRKGKTNPDHQVMIIHDDGTLEVKPQEDPVQLKLYAEHNKECERRGAEMYNCGWGQTDYGVASKTSKGILGSEINPKTMKVTHEWTKY
jgi:hypothetical protein